jgi:two-component system phosphate regulon sensor histidine kinase PhoR
LALNDILVRVEQQYAPEAGRRGLRLETSLANDLPAVVGNALMLERVFANLVYNALKFTPRGGGVMLRSARRGNAVAASVADTGPGLSPEEIPLIFEKRWPHKGEPRQAGNGWGLYIVKSLVEAHGGRVEVDSTPGLGSCFTVLLPTDGKVG